MIYVVDIIDQSVYLSSISLFFKDLGPNIKVCFLECGVLQALVELHVVEFRDLQVSCNYFKRRHDHWLVQLFGGQVHQQHEVVRF